MQGTAQFTLQAYDLFAEAGEYDYAITLRQADGYSMVLSKGIVELLDNVESLSMQYAVTSAVPLDTITAQLRPDSVIQVTAGHTVTHVTETVLTDAQATALPYGAEPTAELVGSELRLGIPRPRDGANGEDGIDGIDGEDGTDGIDGIDGIDGVDGADGVYDPYTAAETQGGIVVVSDTPPDSPYFDTGQSLVPVLWFKHSSELDPRAATPTIPAFNDASETFVVPNLVGVRYMYQGNVCTPGIAIPYDVASYPTTIEVHTVPKPGYVLTSNPVYNRLVIDKDTYTLSGSETFSGYAAGVGPFDEFPNGTTYTSMHTKPFDNALGGDRTDIAWATYPGWVPVSKHGKVDANGWLYGVYDAAHANEPYLKMPIYTGTAEGRLQFDVTKYMQAHSTNVFVQFGNPYQNSGSRFANVPYFYVTNFGGTNSFAIQGKDNNVTKTVSINGIANALGTWDVTFVNGIIRVEAPTGDVVTFDYVDEYPLVNLGPYWTIWMQGLIPSVDQSWRIDNLRVYRPGA